VQGWKSFTAHHLNKHLHRQGAFWMRDYFDRSIRDAEHFERVMRYIQRNPEKAHLKPGAFTLWKAATPWNDGVPAVPRSGGVPATRHTRGETPLSHETAGTPSFPGGEDATAP
jgi:hypothetical protein